MSLELGFRLGQNEGCMHREDCSEWMLVMMHVNHVKEVLQRFSHRALRMKKWELVEPTVQGTDGR